MIEFNFLISIKTINVFSVLGMVWMALIVVLTIIKMSSLDRGRRFNNFQNFKKGRFALVYLFAVPLYWLGYVFIGGEYQGIICFWKALQSTFDLVVLKYDVTVITEIGRSSKLFFIAINIGYFLSLFNALFLAITIFYQKICNYLWLKKAQRVSKLYIVIGYNPQSSMILNSVIKKRETAILVSKQEEKINEYIYTKQIGFLNLNENQELKKILDKYIKEANKKSVNIIINTQNDTTNLVYIEQLSDIILENNLEEYLADDTKGINVYTFGEPENASAFMHFVKKTKGCIHYINKYKLIAMSFVDEHPLTRYMTGQEIDYNRALINEEVDINVAMIGFGKTNQQLFSTSVANNQFLMLKGQKIQNKIVNYWIYDKIDSRNDKNLNYNYFRYENEFQKLVTEENKYLPLPVKPAHEEFFTLNINDSGFYQSIRAHLTSQNNRKAYNYLIIAFGTDLENLDFGEKMINKLKEWEIQKETKVFVKIRNGKLIEDVLIKEYKMYDNLIFFGSEEDEVYNLHQIVAEKKETMAKDRHLCYTFEDDNYSLDYQEVKKKALENWYLKWHQVQRESNIYGCLGIRLKLNLLGYDYCLINPNITNCNNEYLEKYQKNDPIIYNEEKKPVMNKKTIIYNNDLINDSIRHNLALQEHERWNAYMITSGFIPSSIKQIQEEGAKNLDLRRHSNLTTHEGLIEYRKMIAKLKNCSEEETDVIRYDYQLMDDVVWLLEKNGYMIIKKLS